VICADLRGYGGSSKPEGLPDHSNYSKRAMGLDMVELMRTLGHQTFHLVGHDRGGLVAHRLTRDHEAIVRTLAFLDISPTLKMFESTNLAFATAYYHGFMMCNRGRCPRRCWPVKYRSTFSAGSAAPTRSLGLRSGGDRCICACLRGSAGHSCVLRGLSRVRHNSSRPRSRRCRTQD
jgi:haloacetate dehalogenase